MQKGTRVMMDTERIKQEVQLITDSYGLSNDVRLEIQRLVESFYYRGADVGYNDGYEDGHAEGLQESASSDWLSRLHPGF